MSPEPESSPPIVQETAASRVSRRDVLSDLKVERPESSDRDLTHLPATTQKILSAVEKLSRDLSEIPAPLFAQRLSALIDELVSSLVPLMAAEDGVLCPDLDSHLADALRKDHSEVRRLIERLSMLAEGLERRIPSFAKGPMCTTLRQMTSALGDLHTHQLDALCHLDETLTIDEQARLSARLDAAAIDARERTMLIVRPEVPPTASTVLRHRPDLNAAYAMSLAEYDRRSHRDGAAAAEVKPS